MLSFHHRFSLRVTGIVTNVSGVSSCKSHWKLKEPKSRKLRQVHWWGATCTTQWETDCVFIFPLIILFTLSIALAEKIEKNYSLDIQNTIAKHLKVDIQLNSSFEKPSFGIKLQILLFFLFLLKKRSMSAHLFRILRNHWGDPDCTLCGLTTRFLILGTPPSVIWIHSYFQSEGKFVFLQLISSRCDSFQALKRIEIRDNVLKLLISTLLSPNGLPGWITLLRCWCWRQSTSPMTAQISQGLLYAPGNRSHALESQRRQLRHLTTLH